MNINTMKKNEVEDNLIILLVKTDASCSQIKIKALERLKELMLLEKSTTLWEESFWSTQVDLRKNSRSNQ
ncbi:CLUMA_CG016909, isoform A [Clunio marinus]|uniref:CLUMA_CG016909, isoform A n=1 Tax=Clunio marinus TaxID=568069 RepID=A0A1J1IXP5_9DIPT|nr:CLUMA_CG016909, isoform A [Clunio marinus]